MDIKNILRRRYHNMKRRCYNTRCKDYKYYGARGICVSNFWLESFDNFYSDMSKTFLDHVKNYGLKNTSLERRDNDQGYNKDNCRWATYSEQSFNKRHFSKYYQLLPDDLRDKPKYQHAIVVRSRRGMPIDAETMRNIKQRKHFYYRGKPITLRKLFEKFNIPTTYNNVEKRLFERHWPLDKTLDYHRGMKYVEWK